ncbi:DNA replication/repair protein RecF [Caulobacter sp. UNC279MFTsu5.1]|uniref:DNA replication/repair protein RecF n=1 Tax=Caulobacter sp. UNC279MFTsu5.1 TaxID=1502775 RepID=UPI0008EC90C2|nr:DNA replication/repair protein RecF [Caulobacter sp. UNC279MFTsu5.1]SFK13529.1 DNA replication and repair protein RecF [Caulobacter sp. UNC279MFTsu5.1]
MSRAALLSLTLTDFRSYERAQLRPDGASVYLFGANGAGKTNLLEAISLLSPGKGLRGAGLTEVGRRLPGEATGRAWAVAAEAESGEDEPVRLGTGVELAGAARRVVRIEGETVPPGRLADHVRPIWLTPAQDRLFLEAAGERRKFFDRLVFAGEPDHARHANAYDKAQRERMRLLTDAVESGQQADAIWLTALEARLGQAGALMAAARARTLLALQAEIDGRGDRPFPRARLALAGEWEKMALDGVETPEIEARLAAALAAARLRDGAAGRALTGPHRGDLAIHHVDKDRPAAECSTGEQKALILNLVLAQAARLSRANDAPNPILLLDEVAAHLDLKRRAALADEITALGLQAFLTGTDESLFDHLKGRALGVRVSELGLTALEDV